MTSQPGGPPKINVLLEGLGVNTSVGLAALCAVVLVEGNDAEGNLKRILIDPAHVGRRTYLWDALAARGLGPGDIDLVVLTHAHWDHVQNIDVFDHAPLLVHPDELRYAMDPHRNDWATPAWTGAILERQIIQEVQDGDELIPGVGIIDMAGHTVGSIGVTVQNADGLSIITGDALHYASVAVSRVNPLVFWDADLALASIDRAVSLADVIYPGHDRAFRVTKDNEIEYLDPFELTITGVTPDTTGLSFDNVPRPPWLMPGVEDLAARKQEFREAAEKRRQERADRSAQG